MNVYDVIVHVTSEPCMCIWRHCGYDVRAKCVRFVGGQMYWWLKRVIVVVDWWLDCCCCGYCCCCCCCRLDTFKLSHSSGIVFTVLRLPCQILDWQLATFMQHIAIPPRPATPILVVVVVVVMETSTFRQLLDEHFGEGVGTTRSDVRLCGMEGDIEDSLVELLSMGGDLLDTCFVLHVP